MDAVQKIIKIVYIRVNSTNVTSNKQETPEPF